MLVAVIADTHLGARNDNRAIQNNQIKFFEDLFFPVLKHLKIKHIIHLGDLVDKRRSIDILTLKMMRKHFLDRLASEKITMDLICGNHDTYYKSTNSLNTLDELLGEYVEGGLIKTYIEPSHAWIDDTHVAYLPWVTEENNEATIDLVSKTEAKYAFGHLELVGFEHHLGHMATTGKSRNLLSDFEHVWTGHFHQPSIQDNISYLGAPYEMTWSDYGCVRGFGIWNSDNGGMKHVANPLTQFARITYDDSKGAVSPISVENKFVKVDVIHKSDALAYERYLDELRNNNPTDLKVNDLLEMFEDGEDKVVEGKDTKTILFDEIETLGRPDQDEIHKMVTDIFIQATDTKV